MDDRDVAARRGSWLFVIAGLLALAGNRLPNMPRHDEMAVDLLGMADLLVGVLLRMLPWRRWPAYTPLVAAAPVAFFLIGRFERSGALSPFSYACFFIVVFVWIGVSYPPRTSYVLAPLAGLLYVLPLRAPGHPADAAQSVMVAIPVCLMVGETAARAVARLHRSVTELARVNRESDHRAALLGAVARAGRSINRLDPDAVMIEVLDAIRDLEFDLAWLALYDDTTDVFVMAHTRGLPEDVAGQRYPAAGGLPAAVRSRGQVVVIEDCASDPLAPPEARQAGVRALLAAPVHHEGQIVALLCGASLRTLRLTAQDVEAFELLAAQAGVALDNARRFQIQRQHAERAEAACRLDDLTGLGNRRHAQTLLDALRPGDGILLLDLDGFKQINDTYGHAAGDQLLARLGQYLRLHVRDSDDVARFGGDEFLIRFPAVGEHSTTAARRLLDGWSHDNPDVPATGGLAFHQRGHSPADTLQRADAALYRAKHSGRGQLEVDQAPSRTGPVVLLPD